MPRVVTFGEVMLRLSPQNNNRFVQANNFDVVYGGGESNVAVSLSQFGYQTEFITKLPNNDLGVACRNFLRQFGVDTHHISWGGERLGIYFLERGAVHRGSNVIYDRAGSAFSEMKAGEIDWDTVFENADWFHWTGITPAISENVAAVCQEGLQCAKEHNITISCDINYRSKLWNWGKNPKEVMNELASYCDVLIGNEEDAEKTFGFSAPNTDVTSGKLEPDNYLRVCKRLSEQFPNLKTIGITLRGSISASYNTWSGLLWKEDKLYQSTDYEIVPIVDRVGGGDSFVAGLIYGLLNYGPDWQKALDFAVASSALKHTIFGDFNLIRVSDVENLMEGNKSGRVSR